MKRIVLCSMSIFLLGMASSCSKNKPTIDSSSSSEKIVKKSNSLDDAIDLIVKRKYDEALAELEKINIKDSKNQKAKELIKQLNLFKEASELATKKEYEKAVKKYQLIVDDKNSIESLKADAKKEIEKLKGLMDSSKSIKEQKQEEVTNTYSSYVNEREALKNNSQNPGVIDTIPDATFKKLYEDYYNNGVMEVSESNLLKEIDKIYPNAQINVNAEVGPGKGISNEQEAVKLAETLLDESKRSEYELTATDQGEYFMVFGQMSNPSEQSMATNVYYHIYKNGVIERVDRNGNPIN